MPYSLHAKVSFGGSLDTGDPAQSEIWNCSVNVAPPIAWSTADAATYMTEIYPALASWFGASLTAMSSDASLEYVKVNNIGANGRYVDPTTTNRHDFSPVEHGLGSPIWPGILCAVVSWTTSRMRGPGSHGRVYLPNGCNGTSSEMFIGASQRNIYVAAGVVLINLLKNTSGTRPAAPCVASGVDASLVAITGVRVGSIVDVQRRRKNALIETYTSASV